MKKPFALALSALLGGAAVANAQIPDYSPNAAPAQTYAVAPETVYFADAVEPTKVSASVEAMAWWFKAAPLSVPTLTTFVPGSPSETNGFGGALGIPGTIVLSPERFNYGGALSGRALLGINLDETVSVEISGFTTERQTAQFGVQSFADGTPPLRVPFINQSALSGFPVGESSFIVADVFPPGVPFASGGQFITSASQLWGLEANGVFHRTSFGSTNVSFLGGFRYLDLQEDLDILTIENQIGFGTFRGTDSFSTRNQFYGGQIGVRAETFYSVVFLSAEAKLALGWNHESVGITGASTSSAPGTPQSGPGAIFSQISNIGRRSSDEITVVPSLLVKAGANVTPRIRAFVGYDLLFISNVVRPGNQLDRTINFNQNVVVMEGIFPNDAPLRPTPQHNTTDFWAQGISLGLEFRY